MPAACSVGALDLHLAAADAALALDDAAGGRGLKESPGRTKRGSAGWTITGSRTAIWPVANPKRSAPLTALARSLKFVRLSGSATRTSAVPSGADGDRRVEVRHGLEVAPHRRAVEQVERLAHLGHVAAGRLGERQEADDEVARVAHEQARDDLRDEVRQRVEPLLGREREHRLVDEPERDLARRAARRAGRRGGSSR